MVKEQQATSPTMQVITSVPRRAAFPRGAEKFLSAPLPLSDRPRPEVQPSDWIFIGRRQGVDAVVCEVYPRRVRVVYLNSSLWAMDEWAVWRRARRAFEPAGICGYADHEQDLCEFVMRLRLGERH
jgi:hypothetical protein